MGRNVGFKSIAAYINNADVLSIEVPILKANVPIVRKWRADTSQQLPTQSSVRIIIDAIKTAVWIANINCTRKIGAYDTNTSADEALKSIVFAKVKQAIQHEAQEVAFAGTVKYSVDRADVVKLGFFVANFGFQTEGAEVVTYNRPEIITSVMTNGYIRVVNISIFNQHNAAVDTNIPLAISSKSWRGQCR